MSEAHEWGIFRHKCNFWNYFTACTSALMTNSIGMKVVIYPGRKCSVKQHNWLNHVSRKCTKPASDFSNVNWKFLSKCYMLIKERPFHNVSNLCLPRKLKKNSQSSTDLLMISPSWWMNWLWSRKSSTINEEKLTPFFGSCAFSINEK